MGMAASQARFLGLTARKSNTEYEGQQVNQQRTTLSNQSANYYNELLGMTVPTPPSIDDYTKTTYSFTDGALSSTINSLIAQTNGTYKVSYTRRWTNENAIVSASSSIVTKTTREVAKTDKDGNTVLDANKNQVMETVNVYNIGSKILRSLGDTDPSKVSSDDYLSTLTETQRTQLAAEEEQYKIMLNNKFGFDEDEDWQVIYRQNTTTNTWSPVFYRAKDLENALYSDTGSSISYIRAYTVGQAVETDEVKNAKARLEQDTSGRYINITLYDDNDVPTTYAINTTSSTDQAAYDDAMNQYEYEKAKYDSSVQDINAKIEIIQSEDKSLELRLKQLDTEQEAIQTEMEAVQKVIEKNTQDTFKTFG